MIIETYGKCTKIQSFFRKIQDPNILGKITGKNQETEYITLNKQINLEDFDNDSEECE